MMGHIIQSGPQADVSHKSQGQIRMNLRKELVSYLTIQKLGTLNITFFHLLTLVCSSFYITYS